MQYQEEHWIGIWRPSCEVLWLLGNPLALGLLPITFWGRYHGHLALWVFTQVDSHSQIIKCKLPGSFPVLAVCVLLIPVLAEKLCVWQVLLINGCVPKGSFPRWLFSTSMICPYGQCYMRCLYPRSSSPGCLNYNVSDWHYERALGRRFGKCWDCLIKLNWSIVCLMCCYPTFGALFQITGATKMARKCGNPFSPCATSRVIGEGGAKCVASSSSWKMNSFSHGIMICYSDTLCSSKP